MRQYEDIKIFYDGSDITRYGNLYYIEGFTTNPLSIIKSNITSYRDFYNKYKDIIDNKYISFEVFKDNDRDIINDAKAIASYGTNIYASIPIIKLNGDSNLKVIKTILKKRINVNIINIFTESQLLNIYNSLKNISNSSIIISVSAGMISNTSINPNKIMEFACKLFKENDNIKILWNGCKDILSIQEAINAGCDMISVYDNIIESFTYLNKDLESLSTINKNNFDYISAKQSITV